MEQITQWLGQYLSTAEINNVADWLVRALLLLVVLYLVHFIIIRRVKYLSKKTANDYDDLLADILISLGSPFYFFLAIYIASLFYQLPYDANFYIEKASFLIFIYYAVRAIASVINFGFKKALKMQTKEDRDPTLIAVLNRLAGIILWIIAALIVLQNFNFNVSAIIGGLGITGIAVALAIQNILADIFSFVSIYFDKPFKIGDFITIGEDSGTVERIGLKTTRLRTLRGEELIISNQELSSTRVNNFRKLQERSIELNIGIDYNTSHTKLEKIPEIIRKIILKDRKLKYAWVRLVEFGDSGLIFNIFCYVKSQDYEVYLDKKQDLILAIYKELRKQKIDLSYPTQTVYLRK